MIFDFITVTGADDQVDYETIEQLDAEHIEWGVLISEKRAGKPRYPSAEWVNGLEARFRVNDFGPFLSMHVCGDHCDWLVEYAGGLVENRVWTRMQLNSFPDSLYSVPMVNLLASRMRTWNSDIILPVPNEKVRDHCRQNFLSNVQFLYDGSRGKGVLPQEWPENDFPEGVSVGYAGGIDEDNIRQVLDTLCARPGDRSFWIDLESGARTDDRFDAEKVARLTKIAGGYVGWC